MARIIYKATHHNCYTELKADIDSDMHSDLYYGSIVECSCGKRYIKAEDQRDGAYWKEYNGDYDG